MSESSHANHARYGRVFETSMLCFEIKKCDCCGISIPFHDDPQQQKLANSKDHSFRRLPSDRGAARPHDFEAFPIATFSDTVIKPQPGHQYYFEFNEETELLIVLYVPASRRPSFVVRERLPSGQLLFLLFDPASTSDAEQVQAMFEESISDLFEPGMHEWRQVTIPTDESHHDRYLLAAASLTMWLTVWQQNNTVFHDNSVELKFVPNASSTSLAAWARKWMHGSLVAGELKSHEEEPIMEVLEVVANP
jgi:hypothetical protein